jgi:long-chain fatty acid transport protein
MTVLKLGAQWGVSDAWTLRAGYSHANQQVPSGEVGLNIVTPAVVRQHLTAGVSFAPTRGPELSLSIAYALPETVSGQAPLQFGGHPITLENEQLEFEIGLAWIR